MSVPGTFFRRNDSYTSITVRAPSYIEANGGAGANNTANNINNNNNSNINNNPRQRKVSKFMPNFNKSSFDSSSVEGGGGGGGGGGGNQNNHTQGRSSVTGYLSHRYEHPQVEHDRREKITINVSGERYQTYVDTLDRFPQTLLGNSLKREEFYDDVEDEYFFDRDRTAFNAILYYYQSWGQLYCPLTVPMTILVTEAKFFELGNNALRQVLDLQSEDSNLLMPENKFKKQMWCLFEHPETSKAAHILTTFSILMILFSVTVLCIETLPVFRIDLESKSIPTTPKVNSTLTSATNVHTILEQVYNNRTRLKINSSGDVLVLSSRTQPECRCTCKCNVSQTCNDPPLRTTTTIPTVNSLPSLSDEIKKHTEWKSVFHTCEMVSVVWFSFEFIVRFFSCPSKVRFMKGFLNIIDIISILPFYITLALNRHEGIGLENLRVVRLVRVFRIFKLSRHSKGLQILGLTLRASMRELGLMVFFLAIGVILFSSAVYYLETDNFSSIPDAFWWAIITMCTVGYGDKVPRSFWGKLVGSACSVCGVLSIALPVPVIVSNFDYFYNRERTKKMHQGFLEHSKPESFKKNNTGSATKKCENQTQQLPQQQSQTQQQPPTTQRATSPVGNKTRNGSVKSANDSRADEIHRQTTLRGLERRSRKLSQKLSEGSLNSPYRKNGQIFMQATERESFM